jgi:tRNA nucleotidyltransferase (CCA-adding enzyme)
MATHLVLTHEQADFDGIAAAWAVWALDQRAIPVLPRRINRNVRAFLTLYGEQLPFVQIDELAGGQVDQVTLVDTQSLASLKGVGDDTGVHVVDHHPVSAGLPSQWSAHIDEVGATTTILVHDLRDGGVELGFVESTLLMLGIYEDTGSLTYAGTTPADLVAAAWLLQSGADLPLVSEFLDPPLSSEQRILYERLLEGAETHAFYGLTVVIACARTQGRIEEISSVAHKLRDVFDPAGLFVLVEMDGHVQLVARSSSDELDVSKVAEHLGGGGHARAAAAIGHGRNLEAVRAELLELLPTVINPPMTVGEIMSRGPQLLAPGTTIAEAAQRMQRSGHEGYPVVDGRQVLGLLTRRAVDRAMGHGLESRPVSGVMKAGSLAVHPEDSVQHLQREMILNDWGQVPVADEETGEIIGIVTRTDLLRLMGRGEDEPLTRDLSDRLEAALPRGRLKLLRAIALEAEQGESALYIVGGFVRDLLLGTPSVDFDLVVEGDAIQLATRLVKRYGGQVSSHRRFGTAKWQLDLKNASLLQAVAASAGGEPDLPPAVDFVSARSEFYLHPTALPTVERGSIKLDLHRRDFTINTLALRLDGSHYGRLLDHWGGGQDLRDGIIRVLHSLSFVDDPTRMLRAVRLEQRLGFRIEDRTLELLHDAVSLLDRVSGDRIRSELDLVLREQATAAIMRRLAGLDLLAAIHPHLTWDDWIAARWRAAAEFHAPGDWGLEQPPHTEMVCYGLWMVRLDSELIRSVCRRLRIPASDRDAILTAAHVGRMIQQAGPHAAPSVLTEIMDGAPEPSLVVSWLALAEQPAAQEAVVRYLSEWRRVQPRADGNTLRERGLSPGPAYKRILTRLRNAWLDGRVRSDGDEARLLDKLLREEAADG